MEKSTELFDDRIGGLSVSFKLTLDMGLVNHEWDAFLSNTRGGHHVQTSLWAQLKSGYNWSPIRIIAYMDKKIVAGAQLLIRRAGPFASLVYLTKGPILSDICDLAVARAIIEKIILIGNKENALYIAIQPPNNADGVSSILLENGFEQSLLELAPVASLLLDLTPNIEAISANFKRQTRQNIRRGEDAGLIVRDGNEKDLDVFYYFHVETSKRQGFVPYAMEYYKNMWKLFSSDRHIHLFIVEHEMKAITGLLVIPFGDTVLAKILGWSGEKSNFRPNEAVFWHAIKWSKEHGYKYFDFEGMNVDGAKAMLAGASLPVELQHSPDFFKLGFGGNVVIYPPAFELIKNPAVRWLYKKASPRVGGESAISHFMDQLRKH